MPVSCCGALGCWRRTAGPGLGRKGAALLHLGSQRGVLRVLRLQLVEELHHGLPPHDIIRTGQEQGHRAVSRGLTQAARGATKEACLCMSPAGLHPRPTCLPCCWAAAGLFTRPAASVFLPWPRWPGFFHSAARPLLTEARRLCCCSRAYRRLFLALGSRGSIFACRGVPGPLTLSSRAA
jgi:hypothetical protein